MTVTRRRHRWVGSWSRLSLATLSLAGSAGCPPQTDGITAVPPSAAPREATAIVETIRDNAAKLDRSLYSRAVQVTAHFRDDNGKNRSYNLEGSFLFRRPMDLRIDLRPGLGDQAMQIGSNSEAYWVWIEPEVRTMRWGLHRNVGKSCVEKHPLRPDQVVSALGLSGLPTSESGLIGPIRQYGNKVDKLLYVRPNGEGGLPFLEREYWIDRAPPNLIKVVVFKDRFGADAVTAFLDGYRPAWPNGPMVARQISIFWPDNSGALTLDLDQTSGLSPGDVSEGAFAMPKQGGDLPAAIKDIVQIDKRCGG